MLDFYDKATRVLIIKMGEVAKKYKPPYDDMDREQKAKNQALSEEWNVYKKLLEEFSNYA